AVAGDRIASVTPDSQRPADAIALHGLVIPGLVNAHSHAFHRALRGRTQVGEGTFWSWREQMYAAAARLDPDSYLALARGVFAEMALAGITTVGEFHYLHHAPGGSRYNNANAMSIALEQAASEAGIRMTLLDTLYLQGGLDGRPLGEPQLRFGDSSVSDWLDRIGEMPDTQMLRVGAAVHSVRAVSVSQLGEVAGSIDGRPLHVHLSEQLAENADCVEATGMTPTGLLESVGLLGPNTTAVHATHLVAQDLTALSSSAIGVCLCPTTERDLADGIGPARKLVEGGSPLSFGSDSHAVIDLFEEARSTELNERLASGMRGGLAPELLLAAATEGGAAALDWNAGAIRPGLLADFVSVSLDSIRMAGIEPATAAAHIVFGATAADVSDVVAGGRRIVAEGEHQLIERPAYELHTAIARLFQEDL
ncbi:MAG: formimidoylglutamate deiminase, partial [Acidimicrobiales bacterium]